MGALVEVTSLVVMLFIMDVVMRSLERSRALRWEGVIVDLEIGWLLPSPDDADLGLVIHVLLRVGYNPGIVSESCLMTMSCGASHTADGGASSVMA